MIATLWPLPRAWVTEAGSFMNDIMSAVSESTETIQDLCTIGK